MKLNKNISFPARLTILIGIFFFVMFLVVSVMFFYTGEVMEKEAIKHIEYNTSEITQSIDETIFNIYNVSDTFAIDDRLREYTDVDIKGSIEKRQITAQISNVLFASYDLLRKNEKMAAFYNNSTGELFNFLDPNADDTECKKILMSMNINGSEKLAKFHWYEVRDNFLKQDKTGVTRKDRVIIGSRRVFSRLQNMYTGVHIFAVDEDIIYKKYIDTVSQYKAKVYVVNEEGRLFSTSEMDVLMDGYMDSSLMEKVTNREFDRFSYDGNLVCVNKSKVNDWLTIVCVPESTLKDVVTKLYRWMFFILLVFAVCACVMIYVMYKTFMYPISKLNNSMIRVHNGDFNAYVDVTGNDELVRMIDYYNSMLESINHNITERLNMEQHKKQLEMDVLMNQINPHFLYNTLETIVWKSSEAGHPDIGRIAAALGRMYRLSISGGNLFISMKQELEHVSAYIKIQQSRYGDAFWFDMRADYGELNHFYTIKIILQPLIENSLSHGLEKLDRKMGIRVSIKILSDCINVRIIDNGIGMDKVRLSRVRRQILTGNRDEVNVVRKKSTGIGMHNVYERLKIYFGDRSGMTIWSKRNIGTVINLTLPLISANEAKTLNDVKNR